jgi:hypothetical protein
MKAEKGYKPQQELSGSLSTKKDITSNIYRKSDYKKF